MQENLAGELWLDLSGRILGRFLLSHMKVISLEMSHPLPLICCPMGGTAQDILTPSLRAISCIISIIMLVAGILYVGGGSSFVLIISMLLMYILLSYSITPTLRVASKLKIITRKIY